MEEMNVHDYMQEVKDRFKAEWPEARMVYFVAEKKVNNDDTGNTYSCGRVTETMAEGARLLTHIAVGDSGAYKVIRDSFLDAMVNLRPDMLELPAERNLRNAIIDLAKACNLQCDAKKSVETIRQSPVKEKKGKTYIHTMGMEVKPAYAESHITELKEEIKRLERLTDPETRMKLIQAELKRLTRIGKLDQAKECEKDMATLQRVLDKKKRISELGKANWKKAQEALAEKRRKKKQAEADRNRKQPNFQKMAKKKMQQIAARQAERNQRGRTGNGGDVVKSCSMFNNVG